jgi:hypothetical protein
MAWWKGMSLWPGDADVGVGRGVHRVNGDPHLDIEGVPDLEHLPWIDPTHPP